MKTAPPPLAVARTEGVRLFLEDGRELVDGILVVGEVEHPDRHAAGFEPAQTGSADHERRIVTGIAERQQQILFEYAKEHGIKKEKLQRFLKELDLA